MWHNVLTYTLATRTWNFASELSCSTAQCYMKCFWSEFTEKSCMWKMNLFSHPHKFVKALRPKKIKYSPWSKLRLEIWQLKIRWLVSAVQVKNWKSGFRSRSGMVIWVDTKSVRSTTRDKGLLLFSLETVSVTVCVYTNATLLRRLMYVQLLK